ncbi:MAG: cupin domain-containing protein [Alphaproteobacteria bacterium]|nr:MAG: cupin domain-containing protein [Alphaproteobacteria bacterium]
MLDLVASDVKSWSKVTMIRARRSTRVPRDGDIWSICCELMIPSSSRMTVEARGMTEGVKDASALYEVERRAQYGARPGFRITELQISPSQKVPWHYHSNIHDTFYVVEGALRIFLQQPKEEVRLARGQTFSVPPKRPHLVTNGGDTSAVFLVLQGIGDYDFVPLT